ncbi:MAG: nicotinate-nucleotide adenylyltransferase [Prevotella sp.]|nr:nicotinate-nucleotide adenylyltransferase [Prevotella sp.]
MRIGIFGGSFNPIHVGHITLAHQLCQLAKLDEVWLMVSPQNPLKQGRNDLLDDRLRFQLARLALHGEEKIVASDFELKLPKPSYTWNTMQCLRQAFPHDTFLLLIGGDNWQNFHRWYHADDILREYQLVVYPRRGSENSYQSVPENVTIAETDLLDVSSTDIRQRIECGEAIADLVPKTIVPLVRRLYSVAKP